MLLEEGLRNSFSRHASVAEQCRNGLEEIEFKLWPERREICSNTVTSVEVPEGYSDTQIVTGLAEKYGILIGGGFRETKGELLRIGHMGYQASAANMMATLEAMKRTMEELRSTKPIAAR
jgi:aspartate aminotransferase-like enzyme